MGCGTFGGTIYWPATIRFSIAFEASLRPSEGKEDTVLRRNIVSLRIGLSSVFVGDQGSALRFYTEVLGFVKKKDIPVGEFRFLTVASPQGPEGVELLLEPNSHPAAKAFQEAIYKDGIPAAAFFAEDVQREYERLEKRGVVFTMPPTKTELMTFAVFDDKCGNLIQLVQG